MRAPEEGAAPGRRGPAHSALAAGTIALALLTVLLALLFVALVLVAATEGPVVEVARASNVASAIGEALVGGVALGEPEPSARVCWFSRACR